MNYGRINKVDIANGPGVRVSLFVSGCRNHCKGCFNKETWNFNYGTEYTSDTATEILKMLRPDYIAGLSILGGDPFEPENIDTVMKLCKFAKTVYPKKTIWVYTGYLWEDFKDHEIMQWIDVLVDGPFVEAEKNLSLAFRGSENQRIIDIPESMKRGCAIRWRNNK